MASIHRLKHVERLTTAALAHHNSIRTHAKRISDELPDSDLTAPLLVGRSGLERNDVLGRKLKFSGILDRHDPLRIRDEGGEEFQCGGFS